MRLPLLSPSKPQQRLNKDETRLDGPFQFNASNIKFIDTEAYLKPEVDMAAVRGDMLCDYKEQKVYKVFTQSLKEHSPEA